jgi:hypothetical protein
MGRFRLAAAAIVFLAPLAVFSQHSAPPPPPAVSMVSHVSPPPPVIHSAFVGSPRTSITTQQPSASGFHAAAKTNHPMARARANENTASQSGIKSQPERTGLFSFLHRRQPIKCTHGVCAPSPSTNSESRAVASAASAQQPELGCRVVPLPNFGTPCNMYAPCCP